MRLGLYAAAVTLYTWRRLTLSWAVPFGPVRAGTAYTHLPVSKKSIGIACTGLHLIRVIHE